MSVGNLPSGASVLIKITYVSELVVEGEHVLFSLPGSVAPWKQEAALDENIQTDVEKVKVKEQRSAGQRAASMLLFGGLLLVLCLTYSCVPLAKTSQSKSPWRCHLI